MHAKIIIVIIAIAIVIVTVIEVKKIFAVVK